MKMRYLEINDLEIPTEFVKVFNLLDVQLVQGDLKNIIHDNVVMNNNNNNNNNNNIINMIN